MALPDSVSVVVLVALLAIAFVWLQNGPTQATAPVISLEALESAVNGCGARKASSNSGTPIPLEKQARLIYVCGPSSIGKTSTIAELVRLFEAKTIHTRVIKIDDFYFSAEAGSLHAELLNCAYNPDEKLSQPPRCCDLGVCRQPSWENSTRITSGPYSFRALFCAMHAELEQLDPTANDMVIVDDVIPFAGPERRVAAESLGRALSNKQVFAVALWARDPLAGLHTVRTREAARAATDRRHAGQGAGHYFAAHQWFSYDLWLDATKATPRTLAQQIETTLRTANFWSAPQERFARPRVILPALPAPAARPVLVLDIDDTLCQLISDPEQRVVRWYGERERVELESVTGEWHEDLGVSKADLRERLFDFFSTHGLDVPAMPWAPSALHRLQHTFKLHAVSARPHAVLEITRAWLFKHFPGLFRVETVHVTDKYGVRGSELSTKVGNFQKLRANVVVEDNVFDATDAASVASMILVVVFDLNGRFGWTKQAPPGIDIERVKSRLHALRIVACALHRGLAMEALPEVSYWEARADVLRRSLRNAEENVEEVCASRKGCPIVRAHNWAQIEELLSFFTDGVTPPFNEDFPSQEPLHG